MSPVNPSQPHPSGTFTLGQGIGGLSTLQRAGQNMPQQQSGRPGQPVQRPPMPANSGQSAPNNFPAAKQSSVVPNIIPLPLAQNQSGNQPRPTTTGTPTKPSGLGDLFENNTNMLTPENRALIQSFLSGNRQNPEPASGPVKQIVIHFERKIEPETGQNVAEHIVFEMNYELGTWKKLRRKKREGIPGQSVKMTQPPARPNT